MKYNYNSLRNYALRYYFKYFPSRNKLYLKLTEKSDEQELVNKVLENISHLINESQVIWDKIRLYLMKNKNLSYIKWKLQEKLFEKELVLHILENDFLIEWESLLHEKSLRIKIENYKTKAKSISYIKQKLIERSEDRELVENLIWEIFESGETDSIIKEIEKLKNRYDQVNWTCSRESSLVDNKKIIQKLIAKWFHYNEIKKYVT